MPFTYTPMMQAKMQRLFDTCIITEKKYADIDKDIKQILKSKDRYYSISSSCNVPWYVTGIIHKTICDCDFKTHLYNGDPLNGRTVHIPSGFPKKGRPPFTWEQSVTDLFSFYRWDKWNDWTIPGVLYNLETVSRVEYTDDEKASKLWCFSNHFESGTKNESERCGGATLLRRMTEQQLIPLSSSLEKRLDVMKTLGSEIAYMPNRSTPKAIELQRLMNISGACVREDGRIGKLSAKAFHEITREYLKGDPDAGL